MKIPVMLSLPTQENLRASAISFRTGAPASDQLTRLRLPKRFKLDVSFPAVPIGSEIKRDSVDSFSARRSDVDFNRIRNEIALSLSAEQSERFLIRGSIDVDQLDDVPEQLDDAQVLADPIIQPFHSRVPYCGLPAVGAAGDVLRLLNSGALLANGLDGRNVAIAIVDTGINMAHISGKFPAALFDITNSWAPPGGTIVPGSARVDHGTMCAYNALLLAPNATLIDVPILSIPARGGSGMSGYLSTAVHAYAALLANWSVLFAPGGLDQYSALVISNSWGIYHPSWDLPAGHRGRFCDNPSHSFNQLVSLMVASGADVVFAAGNCGADCPSWKCSSRTTGSIMGSSANADVICVAGCDVADVRIGYSSQGPSIGGMPQDKPDITAYTHFVGSEAFGVGAPDDGTSTSCPVVAGCVAAIRTKCTPAVLAPKALATEFLNTARQVAGAPGTRNQDYGFGIIDPLATAMRLGL